MQLLAWLDGLEEHRFVLEARLNGPTFVTLTCAFMIGLKSAQAAWYHAQIHFWAALQALPIDPYQWPNVAVTPDGTLQPVNADMNVEIDQ